MSGIEEDYSVQSSIIEREIHSLITDNLIFAKVVAKNAESIQNDGVLHKDAELFVKLDPSPDGVSSVVYGFLMVLGIQSPVAAGFKYTLEAPNFGGQFIKGALSSETPAQYVSFDTVVVVVTNAISQTLVITGRIDSFDPDVFQLKWAQNVSDAGTTTRNQGSYVIVWKENP